MELDVKLKINLIDCCNCGTPIVLPENLERTLRQSHRSFYCPSGHPESFPGQTVEEKLRKRLHEAEIEKTRLVQQARVDLAAAEAETARLKKRTHAGLCTCCNRSFANLARHMASKHKGQ